MTLSLCKSTHNLNTTFFLLQHLHFSPAMKTFASIGNLRIFYPTFVKELTRLLGPVDVHLLTLAGLVLLLEEGRGDSVRHLHLGKQVK